MTASTTPADVADTTQATVADLTTEQAMQAIDSTKATTTITESETTSTVTTTMAFACPADYYQIGTLTANNDMNGPGLGQSVQSTIDDCRGLCDATSNCVAFMYGGCLSCQQNAGAQTFQLCELAASKTPNNDWGTAFIFCAQEEAGTSTTEVYSNVSFTSGKFEQHRLFTGKKRPSVWQSVLVGVSACLMVIGALLLLALRLQPWRASGYCYTRVNQQELFEEELFDEKGLEPLAE
jgi:hypothetical protein